MEIVFDCMQLVPTLIISMFFLYAADETRGERRDADAQRRCLQCKAALIRITIAAVFKLKILVEH